MAPLKFEDSIREKLEQRSIRPSHGSWDKLEDKLDNQLGQKKIKKYWWVGIAASFVGLLIVTTFLIRSNNKIKPSNPQFVNVTEEDFNQDMLKDAEVEEIIEPEQVSNIIENKQETKKEVTEIVVADLNKEETKRTEKHENVKKETPKSDQIVIPENMFDEKTNEAITLRTDTIDSKLTEESNSLDITTELIESKVSSLVAQIKELEKNNKKVTDQEIEALLRKAQLEITTQQILKSNTVSASALLLDVESELDESFKNRVFEALKTGFEKLKTTVAERDN
ncbi:hypothetical protein D1815_20765 [Aquimarina sp. AD1]|uniref:hypothetical protein n=1 Tax=Aquimarina sp. (strain AD1) TaxID=1714848 RepID=UPI000E4B168C|nr:hypothetical protein [Aquimarina sp. AD1]AXT58071.1 hypothetical protein D1815_20765 [Aquimarina sp. AD1]RKN25627.1 hypothetical protein D7035_10010 [Aquimarina sp. AD1]